jgi:hypothetical protein
VWAGALATVRQACWPEVLWVPALRACPSTRQPTLRRPLLSTNLSLQLIFFAIDARVANAGGSPAYNQMMMAGISPQGGLSPYHHSPENQGISPNRAGPGAMISPNPASSVHLAGRQGSSPAYNPISPSYQGGMPGPNHSLPMQGQQQPPSRPGDPYCPLSPAYAPQQPKKDK